MPTQPTSSAYVIGLDYGTDSVRALLVDARTGAEVAQAVHYYPRWKQGQYCNARPEPLSPAPARPPRRAGSHGARSGRQSARRADSWVSPSTPPAPRPAPVNAQGAAAGPATPEFAENPNALFVLWKDHTALAEAAEINHKARTWGGEDFTKYSGGIYSLGVVLGQNNARGARGRGRGPAPPTPGWSTATG
ncbi:MAG: hypothetical protein WKG07_19835 [Hymenobacter sp.]